MRAILMAAGRGSRISRHIGNNPKCTLDIGGVALVRHTVEMLQKAGIEVGLVLGYRGEVIQQVLQDLPVTYFHNPFYDVTNSIASLWFARNWLDGEDLILANADVYWDEALLQSLIADERQPLMLADSTRKENGDYRFFWDANDVLVDHGKELQMPRISGEYVGVAILRGTLHTCVLERLEKLIASQQHHLWWENVLYSYIGEKPIHVLDIAPRFWGEVDYIEDYERIIAHRQEQGLLPADWQGLSSLPIKPSSEINDKG